MLSDADILDTPLADLTALARVVRDGAHGRRVTYSPKVFIPLTMLCRDRCGYCTFAKAPARLESPYLTAEEVLAVARAGRDAGCHEALFTLGERPELRYPVARDWLAAHGHGSTVDYLAEMCRLVLEETGLLPHANAGALFPDELARLREVSASQGMMVESLAEGLAAHRGAPDKEPARRLATIVRELPASDVFLEVDAKNIASIRCGQSFFKSGLRLGKSPCRARVPPCRGERSARMPMPIPPPRIVLMR